jgi:hypothetical protein
VTFACSDAGAGLDGAAPPDELVSAEGAGQLRSGACADRDGHVSTASSGPISIDKSPPAGTIACPEAVTVGDAATASWTATDALSGAAGATEGAIEPRPGGRSRPAASCGSRCRAQAPSATGA